MFINFNSDYFVTATVAERHHRFKNLYKEFKSHVYYGIRYGKSERWKAPQKSKQLDKSDHKIPSQSDFCSYLVVNSTFENEGTIL